MKTFLILSLFLAPACLAQQWEFGASAGGSFVHGLPVTASSGSATAGFKPGAVFGAFLGQNLYRRVGGEIRYGYVMGALRAQSGGQEATFAGAAHTVEYDVLVHSGTRESRTRAFVAFGGGMKVFRGTGKEAAFQPLSQYVYLTKTQTVKPMASVGGGVRLALAPRIFLRLEVRDNMTPFPKEVITPAIGAKIGGTLLHDIVPMATIGFLL